MASFPRHRYNSPYAIAHQNVSELEVRVLDAINKHDNTDMPNDEGRFACFASNARLADELNISEAALRNRVRRLRQRGYIVVVKVDRTGLHMRRVVLVDRVEEPTPREVIERKNGRTVRRKRRPDEKTQEALQAERQAFHDEMQRELGGSSTIEQRGSSSNEPHKESYGKVKKNTPKPPLKKGASDPFFSGRTDQVVASPGDPDGPPATHQPSPGNQGVASPAGAGAVGVVDTHNNDGGTNPATPLQPSATIGHQQATVVHPVDGDPASEQLSPPAAAGGVGVDNQGQPTTNSDSPDDLDDMDATELPDTGSPGGKKGRDYIAQMHALPIGVLSTHFVLEAITRNEARMFMSRWDDGTIDEAKLTLTVNSLRRQGGDLVEGVPRFPTSFRDFLKNFETYHDQVLQGPVYQELLDDLELRLYPLTINERWATELDMDSTVADITRYGCGIPALLELMGQSHKSNIRWAYAAMLVRVGGVVPEAHRLAVIQQLAVHPHAASVIPEYGGGDLHAHLGVVQADLEQAAERATARYQALRLDLKRVLSHSIIFEIKAMAERIMQEEFERFLAPSTTNAPPRLPPIPPPMPLPDLPDFQRQVAVQRQARRVLDTSATWQEFQTGFPSMMKLPNEALEQPDTGESENTRWLQAAVLVQRGRPVPHWLRLPALRQLTYRPTAHGILEPFKIDLHAALGTTPAQLEGIRRAVDETLFEILTQLVSQTNAPSLVAQWKLREQVARLDHEPYAAIRSPGFSDAGIPLLAASAAVPP
jgi:DNA-binding MarR family transcriptional regulator